MKKFSIILCIFWMGFIFYMSGLNGAASNEKSFAVVKTIKSQANLPGNSKVPKTALDRKINLYIRKNAHAFEFLMLAVLVANALFINKVIGKASLPIIMFICLFYAVLDEFHESFIPGRASLVSDVLIDFTGSMIGIIIFYLIYYRIYHRRSLKKLGR